MVNFQKELIVISYSMIINNKSILFESLFSLDNDVVIIQGIHVGMGEQFLSFLPSFFLYVCIL